MLALLEVVGSVPQILAPRFVNKLSVFEVCVKNKISSQVFSCCTLNLRNYFQKNNSFFI